MKSVSAHICRMCRRAVTFFVYNAYILIVLLFQSRRRWKVCDLRFLCQPTHFSSYMRGMQLRKFRGALRHLRESGCHRCLLLSRVRATRERSRWLSQNCQSRNGKSFHGLYHDGCVHSQSVWCHSHTSFCFRTILFSLIYLDRQKPIYFTREKNMDSKKDSQNIAVGFFGSGRVGAPTAMANLVLFAHWRKVLFFGSFHSIIFFCASSK